MFCYLVEDFGKRMFFSPLFSYPICGWVNGAGGMLRASQEADPWILGKSRTCLRCGGGEAAGDTVDHLRGFSVLITWHCAGNCSRQKCPELLFPEESPLRRGHGAALQHLHVPVGRVAHSEVEMSCSSLTFSSAQWGSSGCHRNSYRAKTVAAWL